MAFENLGKFILVLKVYIVNFDVNASIVGPFFVKPTITSWKFFRSAFFNYGLFFFGEIGADYFFIKEGGFDKALGEVFIS